MNKKFEQFFAENGMTVNGNFAYGSVKGYETNAALQTYEQGPFSIHISFHSTDQQQHKIDDALRAAAIKYFSYKFTPYGLSIGITDLTLGRLLKNLPVVLNRVYDILAANGAVGIGYCPVCGNELDEENKRQCNVDGFKITMDAKCIEELNAVIEAENKDFEQAPNNYLKGFFGALLGGITGAAVAVVLYLVGFISSLSAFVGVLLGAFLYQKFGGKQNKIMIVIVAVTSLICMVGSVFIVYLIAAAAAIVEAGVSMGVFQAFALLMQDSEFSGLFYSDLAMTVVFSLLGIGFTIFDLARKIRRKKQIG